jgi:hypothetical protein
MGTRSLNLASLALVLTACGGSSPTPPAHPVDPPAKPRAQMTTQEKVAFDFQQAVLASKDAYVALFDYNAVGEYEILLHRYDAVGRLENLDEDQKAQFMGEDGTPYPPERERRNVGNFYKILAQRTVGTGGCVAGDPRTHYGKQLGTFEELPAETPPGYAKLRTDAIGWLQHGGVVGIKCTGGTGGIAVVYTERPNERGYELITIYDD